MTLDDLQRDWKQIFIEDFLGEREALRNLFDECLGRLGKAGTPFAEYLYFAKTTAAGRRVRLIKINGGDTCILLSTSGPGGFHEEAVGWLYYGKPEGSRT
jgi:hypothetical protein